MPCLEKINKILNNAKFCEHLNRINELEKERKFCKHDLKHFLDVARIAYIIVLEKKVNIKKEVIYATALLHDIGRWMQYEENISHELASYRFSEDILNECGFDNEDKEMILNAILNHRNTGSENSFNNIFYTSDKISRNCFTCNAISECNWSKEKKNYDIKY